MRTKWNYKKLSRITSLPNKIIKDYVQQLYKLDVKENAIELNLAFLSYMKENWDIKKNVSTGNMLYDPNEILQLYYKNPKKDRFAGIAKYLSDKDLKEDFQEFLSELAKNGKLDKKPVTIY